MSSIKYRPEIDGLRSVAVGSVVLFHLGLDWIRGGFLGVDVFFVISGYLITSIILRDLERGEFRFATFWARRVRRIAPAMLGMTLATMGLVGWIGFKGLRPEVGAQGLSALLSVANLYFYKQTGDYWGPEAESSPFLHTWSLAVEEQFYLALPVTMFLLHKYLRRYLLGAMVAGLVLSLALFLYAFPKHPTGTFYLLPTRAWELAAGSVLAALMASGFSPKPDQGSLATGGLVLIITSCLLVPGLNGGLVVPVLGTMLVIAFGQTSGLANTVLSAKPVVYLGRISYSLYLWHWPVIVLPEQLDLHLPPWAALPLMLGLSIASFHAIEQTTRQARRTVPVALGGMAVAAALALVLARSTGAYDISQFKPIRYHGFYFDLKPDNFDHVRTEGARAAMNLPAREASPDAYQHGGIILGPNPAAPDVVVLGDSHGVMWSQVIRATGEAFGLTISFYSMDGVPPFFEVPPSKNQQSPFIPSDVKFTFDNARVESLRRWKPKVVLLTTRWSDVKDWELVRGTLEFLRKEAKQVIVIGQPPELTFGNRLAVEQLIYLGIPTPEQGEVALPQGQTEGVRAANAKAQALAEGYDNVTFVGTMDLYTRGEEVLVLKDNQVVYYDDDHLTSYGSELAASRLRDALHAALEKAGTPSTLP